MRKLLLSMVLLLLVVLPRISCKQRVLYRTDSSIAKLVVKISDHCSGAWVGPDVVVTAKHCLDGGAPLTVEGMRAEHVTSMETKQDVIILKVHGANKEDWLEIDSDAFPQVNSSYRVLGYPNMSKHVVVREAIYEGVRVVPTMFAAIPFLQFSGQVINGDSGGVVVGSTGKIIGIISAVTDLNKVLASPVFKLGTFIVDVDK